MRIYGRKGSSMSRCFSASLKCGLTAMNRARRRRESVRLRKRVLVMSLGLEQRVLMAAYPTVASIVRVVPQSQITSATSVSYTVTFDGPVTGVDASDFQVTESNGDVQALAPVVVTGSGAIYTVEVNG